MKELGASADAEHARVGRLARSLGVDVLLAVGEAARPALDGATEADPDDADAPDDRGDEHDVQDGKDGMAGQPGHARSTEAVYAADNEAAVGWLAENLRSDDVLLVKASRGARLDEVAAAVLADTRPDTRGATA